MPDDSIRGLTIIASSREEAQRVVQTWPLAVRVSRRVQHRLRRGYAYAIIGAAIIPAVPAGLLGLSFPDFDISTVGIGHHRFFLFHSAIVPTLLRRAYRHYVTGSTTEGSPGIGTRMLGAALSAFAAGVGVHLLVDGVFQPGKAVLFPVFGSLVTGTLVDDRVWLIGNGLWCLQIARDLLVFAVGDQLATIRTRVDDEFASIRTHGFPKGYE